MKVNGLCRESASIVSCVFTDIVTSLEMRAATYATSDMEQLLKSWIILKSLSILAVCCFLLHLQTGNTTSNIIEGPLEDVFEGQILFTIEGLYLY